MEKRKAIIVIKNGSVAELYSNGRVDIDIIDYDIDEDWEKLDEELEEKKEGMVELF